MQVRKYVEKFLKFIMAFTSALMIWKGMSYIMHCESPIVVVLSESMEPAFQRGDLLFLALTDSPIKVGDICVFKVEGKPVPIVHRVIELRLDAKTGEEYILTKGDNNRIDDRGLYNSGDKYIKRSNVVGRVQAILPYLGMITLAMNDWKTLQYRLCTTLGYSNCKKHRYNE